MPDDIKISALTNVPTLDDSAVFPMVQEINGVMTTLKSSMSQMAGKVAEDTTFVNLQTTSKTLVGAINEAATQGGSVDITTEIDTPAPIMTFNDGGDDIPMKSLLAEIKAVQSGTGTPSPDNVRSISGWQNINVVRFAVTGNIPSDITVYDRWLNQNTLKWAGSSNNKSIAIPCSPNTTYTITGYDDDLTAYKFATIRISTLPDDNATQYDIYQLAYFTSYSEVGKAYTFTTDSQATFIVIQQSPQGMEDLIANGTVAPSTSVVIALGQTVYGGYLDVTSGVLTITHDNIASYNGETINEPWISSIDEYISGTTPSTGAQVVYPLTTPTVLQLTPNQLNTLEGLNNILADSGDILSLEYFNEKANGIASLIELMPKDNYSTDEKIVGTWIDGSPVYEKTVYSAGGVMGNFSITHNIANIDRVLSYSGTVKDTAYSTYGDIWVLPRMATPAFGLDSVTSTVIKVVNPTDFTTRLIDWYITIRYTKTST